MPNHLQQYERWLGQMVSWNPNQVAVLALTPTTLLYLPNALPSQGFKIYASKVMPKLINQKVGIIAPNKQDSHST